MKEKPTGISKKEKAPLYERIRQILESARTSMARTVNTTQVVANWLIGREIVEEEQKGRRRAGYGEELLEDLSAKLTRDFGTGYSVQNLRFIRQLYLTYPALLGDPRIRYAPRSESVSNAESMGIPHAMRAASRRSDKAATSEIGYAPRSESWQPDQLQTFLLLVIPAKAGIQRGRKARKIFWTPVYTGVTEQTGSRFRPGLKPSGAGLVTEQAGPRLLPPDGSPPDRLGDVLAYCHSGEGRNPVALLSRGYTDSTPVFTPGLKPSGAGLLTGHRGNEATLCLHTCEQEKRHSLCGSDIRPDETGMGAQE